MLGVKKCKKKIGKLKENNNLRTHSKDNNVFSTIHLDDLRVTIRLKQIKIILSIYDFFKKENFYSKNIFLISSQYISNLRDLLVTCCYICHLSASLSEKLLKNMKLKCLLQTKKYIIKRDKKKMKENIV